MKYIPYIKFLAILLLPFANVSFSQKVNPDAISITSNSFVEPRSFDEYSEDPQDFSINTETSPPENDWWTNIIYNPDNTGDDIGEHLYAYPLVPAPSTEGLKIYFAGKGAKSGEQIAMDYQLVLTGRLGNEFTPNESIATSWSDWMVNVKTFDSAQPNKYINFTTAHGVPFIYTQIFGFEPTIQGLHGAQYLDENGDLLTFPTTVDKFVILYWEQYYGVHLEEAATISKGLLNSVVIEGFGNGEHIVFSAMKKASDLNFMDQYAFAKPIETNLKWTYSPNSGEVTSTWNIKTQALKAGQTKTIQGFLPHQYTKSQQNFDFNGTEYSSSKGNLKLAIGNSFAFTYKFNRDISDTHSAVTHLNNTSASDKRLMKSATPEYTANANYDERYHFGKKDLLRNAKHMMAHHGKLPVLLTW